MAQTTPMSPTTLFDRIESLKKWQMEQQQRLIQQQSQQSKFLSAEHKRMYEALGIQQNGDNRSLGQNISRERNHFSNNHYEQTLKYSDSDEEIDNSYDTTDQRIQRCIDDIPINSPVKDFNTLLEEKLKTDTPVLNEYGKPRRKFLKKGAGLSRFRMTVDDLAHKKPKPILPTRKKQSLPPNRQKPVDAPKVTRKSSKSIAKPTQTHNIKSTQPVKLSGSRCVEPRKDNSSYDIEPLVLNSKNLALSRKSTNNLALSRKSIDFNTEDSTNQVVTPKTKYSEPKLTWSTIPEQRTLPEAKTTDYEALLAELIEVRQRNPALFETPVINQSSQNEQQIFEKELSEELKLFEILEQKASNSSFCSTSSLVTRLMDHPVRSTPKKQLNFSLLASGIPEEDSVVEVKKLISPPRRAVSFANQDKQYEPSLQEESEDETVVSNDESDSESSSSDSNSSINSDDICTVNTIVPTKYKNQNLNTEVVKKPNKLFKDGATNTDQPFVNSELLKTRLAQLETELDTFRSENARVTKLKSQLETDSRNYEKRKRQLEKEIEEQKQQIKVQLEEDRAKLSKDRAVYNRYAQEIRDGKSARQKERDELNALRSRVTILEEEMKLKEAKWGATQARIRSQLKHLEKDNAALRTENNELRTKNGKLEATNKQLLSRRPSDTKVLHEINKNLTKLAQEAKDKVEPTEKRKSLDKNKKKTPIKNTNRVSLPSKTNPEHNDENKENKRNSLNSTDESRYSTERSFESVEREYEKLFGKSSLQEIEEHTQLPLAEASSCSDTSGRREETVLEDGSIKITYPNGNVRNISADGQLIVMHYHNGDIKETCKETGTIKYLYADSKTWHTTFPDRMEILEFTNGQIEKRLADGTCEILFPNGCRRCTSPDGTEEVAFPDGTVLLTRTSTGERILTLPNGQREIHTRDHKRREYPDGTVKLLYPDGVQETRYANGRIRLKDKQGNLIMDSAAV